MPCWCWLATDGVTDEGQQWREDRQDNNMETKDVLMLLLLLLQGGGRGLESLTVAATEAAAVDTSFTDRLCLDRQGFMKYTWASQLPSRN